LGLQRERRLIAADETAEKADGREVHAWAAIDVDSMGLPAIKATWSMSSMDALLFLSRVLGACTNKPAPVRRGGGPAVLVGLPGAGSGVLPRDVRGQEQGGEVLRLPEEDEGLLQGHKRGEVEDRIAGHVDEHVLRAPQRA